MARTRIIVTRNPTQRRNKFGNQEIVLTITNNVLRKIARNRTSRKSGHRTIREINQSSKEDLGEISVVSLFF